LSWGEVAIEEIAKYKGISVEEAKKRYGALFEEKPRSERFKEAFNELVDLTKKVAEAGKDAPQPLQTILTQMVVMATQKVMSQPDAVDEGVSEAARQLAKLEMIKKFGASEEKKVESGIEKGLSDALGEWAKKEVLKRLEGTPEEKKEDLATSIAQGIIQGLEPYLKSIEEKVAKPKEEKGVDTIQMVEAVLEKKLEDKISTLREEIKKAPTQSAKSELESLVLLLEDLRDRRFKRWLAKRTLLEKMKIEKEKLEAEKSRKTLLEDLGDRVGDAIARGLLASGEEEEMQPLKKEGGVEYYKCVKCGATIPVPEEHGETITCAKCGQVYQYTGGGKK